MAKMRKRSIDNIMGIGVEDNKYELYIKRRGKVKTNVEKRALERGSLKPHTGLINASYFASANIYKTAGDLSVVLTFSTTELVALFSKYVPTNNTKQIKNTHHVDILIALFRALDKGNIYYDKEKKKLYRESKKGSTARIYL